MPKVSTAEEWLRSRSWGTAKVRFTRMTGTTFRCDSAETEAFLEGMLVTARSADRYALKVVAKYMPSLTSPWRDKPVQEAMANARKMLIDGGVEPESPKWVASDRALAHAFIRIRSLHKRCMPAHEEPIVSVRLACGAYYDRPIVVKDGWLWLDRIGWVYPAQTHPDTEGASYAEYARIDDAWWLRLIWAADRTGPAVAKAPVPAPMLTPPKTEDE